MQFEDFEKKMLEGIRAYHQFVEDVHAELTALQTAPLIKQEVSHLKNKRILIVDDAEMNRILMSHFFKRVPVRLEFAESGERAIEKVRQYADAQQPFDMVLMDLQMKTMTGLEAIRQIRGFFQNKIIAVSNQKPSEAEASDSLQAGANLYLSRSLSREELREKIFEVLSASSLSA